MYPTRSINLKDLTPLEIAHLFCELDGEGQAEFFASIHSIAATWPDAGWCQQACDISCHTTPPMRQTIEKLAEHVLAFDEVMRHFEFSVKLLKPWAGASAQVQAMEAVIAKAKGL